MKLVLAVVVVFALPVLPLFAEQFPEGPGKEILEKKCGACHDAAQAVAGDGHTPEEWKDIVQEMIGMGAEIPEDQATILIDYLSKNWPPKKRSNPALGTKTRSNGRTHHGTVLVSRSDRECARALVRRTPSAAPSQNQSSRSMRGRNMRVDERTVLY